MATSTETIRRLTIEGRTTGVKEATADLTALGRAQTKVAEGAEGLAVKTDTSAKRQLSAAKSYDSVRQRVDEVYRAQVQQQKMQMQVQRAYDQGSISNEEYAKTSALVAQHFNRVSGAANDNAKATGTAAQKLGQLSYQVNDVMGGLTSGQSPLTILAQQGTQVSQIFTAGAQTVTGALLAMGGVTVAAGLVAVAAAMSNLRKEMAETGDIAKRVGTSTGDLQALFGAGRYKGVGTDAMADSAQSVAAGLNQALKYSNELNVLFTSNGKSLRDQSGSAKSLTEVMATLGDLVRNAKNDQDAMLVIHQAGLQPTREMVKFLEQGGTQIRLAMEDARRAGGVIDASLTRSAQEFDERWTRAMTNVSFGFRGWTATVISGFDKMSGHAIWSKLLTASTFLPIVGPIIGLGRAVSSATAEKPLDPQTRLNQSFQLANAENERATAGNRTKLAEDTRKLMGIEQQRIGLLGQTASASDAARAAELQLDQAHLNGVDVTDRQRRNLVALAREQALGTFQIKTQTDAVNVQAATIGMTSGAAAEYTAKQTLLNEALRLHKILSEQDRAEIEERAKALGRATEDAARASINDQIKFGRQTALLAPEDVQIAQQLKGLYPDVATALGSVEAQAMRVNATFSALSSTMSSSLVSGLTDIVDGTKSVKQGVADMSKAIIRAMEEAMIKAMIVAPMMRALQMSFGGFLGGSGAIAGGTGNPTTIGGLYHSGGIVGSEPTSTRYIHPAYFDNAPRFHSGLMPEEFPAILQRGEGVFTRGQMAAMGGARSSGAEVKVIINNAPSNPSVTSRPNASGGHDVMIDFENAVVGAVTKNVANNGQLAKAFSARSQGFDGR